MFSQGDKTQGSGFTLIEVCIVLITIGVLTGLVIIERNTFKNRVESCHVESGIKTTTFKDSGTNLLETWKIKKKQEFWKEFKKEKNEKWREDWNEKWRDEWNELKKSDEWLALLLEMNDFKMSTRELK